MIPTNYSITRKAVDFIYQKQKCQKHDDNLKRDVTIRCVGISLSALLFLDVLIHSAGAIQSAFYAIYKGLVTHKPIDFSFVRKHWKCIKVFAEAIPSASYLGATVADFRKKILSYENQHVNAARCLLLSRERDYGKNPPYFEPLHFVESIRSLACGLKPSQKEEMKETLDLLDEAVELEKQFKMLQNRFKLFDPPFVKLLAFAINDLLERNNTVLEKILFGEILSRLLAIGLSITAVSDAIVHVLINTLYAVGIVLHDILFNKQWRFNMDWKEIAKFFLHHLKDMAFTAIELTGGSLIGIISPSHACKMIALHDDIRFTDKSITNTILEKVNNLPDDKSLLIPLVVPLGIFGLTANHLVTILVTKHQNALTVSIITKTPSQIRVLGLTDITYKPGVKAPLNVTVENVPMEAFNSYMSELISLYCLSPDDLLYKVYPELREYNDKQFDPQQKKAETAEELNKILETTLKDTLESITKKGTLLKDPKNLLYCKTQTTGDCIKASLFGALHYHSWKKHGSSKGYKKLIYNIKKLSFRNDRHLLDIGLSLSRCKVKHSALADRRLKKAALKLAFCQV